MEEFLCDLTFWGTFRSKEIWLDAVDIVTKHCDKFSVDGGTLQSMQKEALVVGEPGPGPRRLIRFCAGAVIRKDPFTKEEQNQYKPLMDEMFEHFSARFETKGFIQVCFLWCEVSKGIADIFTNKGVKYVPHVGYVEKLCVTNRFDPDLHDTQLLYMSHFSLMRKRETERERENEREVSKSP